MLKFRQAKELDLSTSRYNMWRAIITMAHADGLVQDEERVYLNRIITNMRTRGYVDDEQEAQLKADIESPQNPADFLRFINDPKYRSQLVTFARILAYKDGNLHPSEEDLLNKLHAWVMDGIDLEQIRASVQENLAQEMTAHEMAIDSMRPDFKNEGEEVEQGGIPLPRIPLYALLDKFMLICGYDLMD